MDLIDYKTSIRAHYESFWKAKATEKRWLDGPYQKLPNEFCILEFEPTERRKMWTYATCCMSQMDDKNPIELHLFSKEKDDTYIELLTIVAYYHRTNNFLDLWHTVNFGRPLVEKSTCSYGLISLPYLDGPNLENSDIKKNVKFYWLIPITKRERDFKFENGIDSLEEAFEKNSFDYLDLYRKSVI
ncbi:suppressor of fused domain protein [Prolixibacter sp. NT017]|uniref:suppressor of fused domain protein n=1 Tax=Prolixibacter sp. NT017 TaxID=2652390 RepID=UPI00127F1ECD|nr:suppressor of fused domain protein [Prolixibacter sp. NT017]GET24695.1 hypothetical protein NT017_10240 [Prolixibacter sp. NT017]